MKAKGIGGGNNKRQRDTYFIRAPIAFFCQNTLSVSLTINEPLLKGYKKSYTPKKDIAFFYFLSANNVWLNMNRITAKTAFSKYIETNISVNKITLMLPKISFFID